MNFFNEKIHFWLIFDHFSFKNIPNEAAAAGFVAALSHKYGFAGLL